MGTPKSAAGVGAPCAVRHRKPALQSPATTPVAQYLPGGHGRQCSGALKLLSDALYVPAAQYVPSTEPAGQ